MWNAQRTQTLYRAFYQMLYPLFAKELEEKLLQEAKDFVIKVTNVIIKRGNGILKLKKPWIHKLKMYVTAAIY